MSKKEGGAWKGYQGSNIMTGMPKSPRNGSKDGSSAKPMYDKDFPDAVKKKS